MSALKLDPAEQWTLDQVLAWRAVRMNWETIARNLGQPVAAVRAKYEHARPAPPAPRAVVRAAALPAAPVPTVRPANVHVPVAPAPKTKKTKGRPKPRTARSVAAPIDLTPELEEAAFAAACLVIGVRPGKAPSPNQWFRARVLAAAGYALWKWRPKKTVAAAFKLHGSMLAPSGMAARKLDDEMVAGVRAALWAKGFQP